VNNQFVIPEGGEDPIVRHRGDFVDGLNYSGNGYFSNVDEDRWFDASGFHSIEEWRLISGEDDATVSTYTPQDVGRNVDSYARDVLGIGSTLADFAREARKQSRLNWRPEYQAQPINDYIRAGYADQ